MAKARQMLEREVSVVPWDSLTPNDPRPYSDFAGPLAALGASDRALAILQRQERAIPPEILRRDGGRVLALALIAYNKGDYRHAIDEFERAAPKLRCSYCTGFLIGQALERLNQPDTAIMVYEQYVNHHDADDNFRSFYLAAGLRRLGEMYESKGDRKKALEYYGRFVDLWKSADPELQPLVSDIRKQMARLAGEPPR
jgi:tetratricopeptide (TPR) repeat protein